MRRLVAYVAFATLTQSAAGQIGQRCPLIIIDGVLQHPTMGPGESFGVTAYQCANCSVKKENGARSEYSFFSEPVVLQTASWTPLRAGDVIEAMNGHPITTRAGANHFTYPPPGETVMTLRRGGERTEVRFAPRQGCGAEFFLNPSRIERVEVLRGQVALLRYGLDAMEGAVIVTTRKDSLRIERPKPPQTVRPDSSPGASPAATHGRYGFALSCVPSCTRVKASDGSDYWKFDGPPPIAGVMPGQPAAMAGLQVGDVVVEIDGVSILSEEGALRFQRSNRQESIQVTIERDGKRTTHALRAR